MKHFTILLVLTVLLTGCSRKEPVEESFNNIGQSVQHLQETLPAECKTSEVMVAIDKIQAEVTDARAKCEIKISNYKTKYERVMSVVILMVLGIFIKFFIKK